MQSLNWKNNLSKYWTKKNLFDLCILLIQLSILIFIAFPNGLATSRNYYGITFGNYFSSDQIIKLYPSFDAGLYLLGAQKFLSGWPHGSDTWFLGCWPPGFFLIESFFMKILGQQCPIILCLAISTVVCWTVVLWNLYLTLTQWQPRPLSAILSMSLCFTQLFDRFFLRNGIILSEPLSIALIILCLSLSSLKASKQN